MNNELFQAIIIYLQIIMYCITNPPQPNEPSYQLFEMVKIALILNIYNIFYVAQCCVWYKIEIYVLGKELHSKLLERASPILLRETQ